MTSAPRRRATTMVLGGGLTGKDGCAAPTRETAQVACFAGQLVGRFADHGAHRFGHGDPVDYEYRFTEDE